MEFLCDLFGHWPVPFASRRVSGRKLNHCWMCSETVVHADGEWRLEHESRGAEHGASRPVLTLVVGAKRG